MLLHLLRFYFSTIALLFKQRAAKQLIVLFSTPRKKVYRKREEAVLKQASLSFVTLAETKIAVYEWGEGNKTAMLVHGWESNAGSLGAFVQPLLALGFKVVAFDAPGHGKSEGKHSNLLYFKRTAKELIQKMGVPDVVIGHSLGANTLIFLAHEEQLSFSTVILISPLNRLMSVFDEFKQLLKLPDSLFQEFIEEFGNQSGDSFWDFYFEQFGRESPLRNVLLLHDETDRVTPINHAERMHSAWPITTFKKLHGFGHYRILWQQKTINSAIDFIKSKIWH